MKKISVILTMLLVSVPLSILPVHSSSGPFGTIGPSDYTDTGKGVDAHRHAIIDGTGPYGAVGIGGTGSGVVSTHAATPGGSGPYGAFAGYGMIPESGATSVDKNGCILVATYCQSDR